MNFCLSQILSPPLLLLHPSIFTHLLHFSVIFSSFSFCFHFLPFPLFSSFSIFFTLNFFLLASFHVILSLSLSFLTTLKCSIRLQVQLLEHLSGFLPFFLSFSFFVFLVFFFSLFLILFFLINSHYPHVDVQ